MERTRMQPSYLRDRNNKVDLLTRVFLIDSTLVVAVFLIRAFEERRVAVSASVTVQAVVDFTPSYDDDNEEFNNVLDESFGEFSMVDYNYTASEILFALDAQAYAAECKAFQEIDDGPEGAEGDNT